MSPDPARTHFANLPYREQLAAISRLLAAGHSEHTAAAASGWSVEAIRRAIGQRQEASNART